MQNPSTNASELSPDGSANPRVNVPLPDAILTMLGVLINHALSEPDRTADLLAYFKETRESSTITLREMVEDLTMMRDMIRMVMTEDDPVRTAEETG